MDARVINDPDFILLKRFGYSMQRLLQRYPDGAPDEIIAQALGMTVSEVESTYQSVIIKLKNQIHGIDSQKDASVVL